MTTKQKAGFTLIEIIVVSAVVFLMATVAYAAINISKARSRDARRLGDMKQIVTALDIYYDQFGHYPDPHSYKPSVSNCGGYDISSDAQPFLDPLLTAGILSQSPTDPLNSGNCSPGPSGTVYAYQYYAAGTNGCPADKGNYYVLGVRYMETSFGQSYSGSPGFSCGNHDWQGTGPYQLNWVTGKFEH